MQLIIVYKITCKSIIYCDLFIGVIQILLLYIRLNNFEKKRKSHISRDGLRTIVISKARVLCKFHICRFNLLRVWYALGASKSVFDDDI